MPSDFVSRMRFRAIEWATNAAIQTRLKTDYLVMRLVRALAKAGGEINRVTGYEQIDALKRRVVEREERMATSRAAAREAKQAFETAVERRSASQREVNDLLQRKSLWTEADVGRFTELVRADHALEQTEARARQATEDAEAAVEREFTAFMRAILDRYHEEQVWSDKIRSVSTYGSLAVVAVNLLVFLLAIVIVEPWKRRRLAQTFERKVEELEKEHLRTTTAAVEHLQRRMDVQDELLGQLVATSATQVHYAPLPKDVTEVFEAESGIPESSPFWNLSSETRKMIFALDMAAIFAAATLAALAWIDR
ncbi:Mdm33 family-domain-containing protein [Vararia minispora EC-137]|uniref:Mdm33 family-domain-containing protein n=1 Tax=Vararia minispora EC-137 TaxID=1314806 RepID=A0ACB8QJR1_9AGAM|nr:Mdm33 family-domain-containing protein [Vararia minispora EC-137]